MHTPACILCTLALRCILNTGGGIVLGGGEVQLYPSYVAFCTDIVMILASWMWQCLTLYIHVCIYKHNTNACGYVCLYPDKAA